MPVFAQTLFYKVEDQFKTVTMEKVAATSIPTTGK